MSRFRWEGHGSGGRTANGEIDARDEHDVARKLAAAGITTIRVELIGEGAAVDFVPPPPSPVKERPHPFRALAAAFVFVLAAAAVGALAPITSYDCSRDARGQTTCTVTERSLGIIPLSKQSLAGVSSVETESGWATYRRSSSTDRRRDVEYDVPQRRLVLRGAGGLSIVPRGWVVESHMIGDSANDIERALSTLLSESRPGRAGGWQANWRPLLIAGLLLLIAALFVALAAIAFSPNASKRLQERVDAFNRRSAARRRA